MQIALIGNESGDLEGGAEIFTKEEQRVARDNGVILKMIDSKTAEERYLASVCGGCDSPVGKWFFFAHYYTPALYGDLPYMLV